MRHPQQQTPQSRNSTITQNKGKSNPSQMDTHSQPIGVKEAAPSSQHPGQGGTPSAANNTITQRKKGEHSKTKRTYPQPIGVKEAPPSSQRPSQGCTTSAANSTITKQKEHKPTQMVIQTNNLRQGGIPQQPAPQSRRHSFSSQQHNHRT